MGDEDEDEAETGTLPEAGKAVSFVLCPIDESTVDASPPPNVGVGVVTGETFGKPTLASAGEEIIVAAWALTW